MQAEERFYTKPKEIADVSPHHQITRVGTSHSPCGTSNCFFSLAVVQGFPNLICLGLAASESMQLKSPTVLAAPRLQSSCGGGTE